MDILKGGRMRTFFEDLRVSGTLAKLSSFSGPLYGAILLAASMAAHGQAAPPPATPAAPEPATQQPASPAQTPDPSASPADLHTAAAGQPAAAASTPTTDSRAKNSKDSVLREGAFSIHTAGGEIREDQLKQLLVGKTLYLRGGYLDNNLEFDEHGRLLSHSPKGSYTLSQIQISKVKLSKKKIELVGDRYALHFLGSAPYDDPNAATDRVKITPKKKAVRISFAREEVEKSKDKAEKKKDKHHRKDGDSKTADSKKSAPQTAAASFAEEPADSQPPLSAAENAENHMAASAATKTNEQSTNRQYDPKPGTNQRTATSSATHSSQALLTALNNVFSLGVDDRMIASMPDFWKLYFEAAQAKTDYKPTDPGVFRQGTVDQKAKLLSAIDPPSNEFAQANAVAGIALYHAVVGSDGKVEEVVAGRPIGFGLDESAEQTIRKATFQPAMKDGKPVPVALDLVVSFRIYSKRTSQPVPMAQATAEKPKEPILPGPYTVQAMAQSQTQTSHQSVAPESATPPDPAVAPPSPATPEQPPSPPQPPPAPQ